MNTIADLATISPRFGRSVRLDGAALDEALDGYMLTARGVDVVERIAHGMEDPSGSRAFSIIGPYGSGKSSFAALIDAALGGDHAAQHVIAAASPDLATRFRAASQTFGRKWIRAVVTAPQREPITTTVLRALHRGAERDRAPKPLRSRAADLLEQARDPEQPSPTWDDLEPLILALASGRALLLVIDEFGKNLEAYAKSDHEADLYLLQQIAETASERPDGAALLVFTVQHLSFEAYAEAASVQQRREWAKVQGRFEDIPFIDSAATARDLIATAIEHDTDPTYTWLRHERAQQDADTAARLALPVSDPDLVAACYPLHPTVLAVLPDLCTRFGQNERTLFSFLASGEPLSVTARNADTVADGLPTLRLDAVYDYFVEAASTLAGASSDATRWVEVSTTVRDASGLSDAQIMVIKTVGVLNLVASYGSVRASRAMLGFAVTGSHAGLTTAKQTAAVITSLEDVGLLVHRDFADEYRIWRGSDFDLADALSHARTVARSEPVADTLTRTLALAPVIAGRHSHARATTRSFARVWSDTAVLPPGLDVPAPHDGTVVLLTDASATLTDVARPETAYPVIVVLPDDTAELRAAAVEVAALIAVGNDDRIDPADTAVRRELVERLDHARQVLSRESQLTYTTALWRWTNPPAGHAVNLGQVRTGAPLSDVFDKAYGLSPRVGYEALNRHELTSQGARIRSNLFRHLLDLDAWDDTDPELLFGFDPYSGEASAFMAVFVASGLVVNDDITEGHRSPGTTRWTWNYDGSNFPDHDISEYDDDTIVDRTHWNTVWNHLTDLLTESDQTRVDGILARLAAPPFGMRSGVASVLVAAHLIQQPARTALFEHDTFVHTLDDAVLERMGRNPANFTVSALNAEPGSANDRKLAFVADALLANPTLRRHAEHLGLDDHAARTVVGLSKWVSYVLHRNDDTYTRSSRTFGQPAGSDMAACATAVRDAIADATRPDRLLYRDLPEAVGLAVRLDVDGRAVDGMTLDQASEYGKALAAALEVIDTARDRLVAHVAAGSLAAAGVDRLTDLLPAMELLDGVRTAPQHVRTLVARLKALDSEVVVAPADKQQAALRVWFDTVASRLVGDPIANWRDPDLDDRTRRVSDAFAELARVARLKRLNVDNSGNTAFAVALTRAGGEQHERIVELPSSLAVTADDTLQQAIDTITSGSGLTDDQALGMLMAAAAGRLMSQPAGTRTPTDDHDSDRSGTND